MDIVIILRRLWRLKLFVGLAGLVAVGIGLAVTYQVSLLPPGIKQDRLRYGAASTQILIDTPRSALGDTQSDFSPLNARASVFSELVVSLPVRKAIAHASGVPAQSIYVASNPGSASQTRSQNEPDGTQRANQLLYEGIGYSLTFDPQPDLPVISISTKAPSAEAAIKLANGAAKGFTRYMAGLSDDEGVPMPNRVEIRQLGTATGGTVNQGASKATVIAVALGAFAVELVLLLLISGVVRDWRRLVREEQAELRQDEAADEDPGATPSPHDHERQHSRPLVAATSRYGHAVD